jgi:tRNA G10  N-methylase Trm11
MKVKRKSPSGSCTTDLVFSARQSQNDEVFKDILTLHVPEKSIIADVTYGKGCFWKKVNATKYTVYKSDILTGTDFRSLPYQKESLDCVVLDPPYMHSATKFSTGTYYNNQSLTNKKWHNSVLELYCQGAIESSRVLKNKGTLIIKCQDEVCAGKNRFTHIELNNLLNKEYLLIDLFVVVAKNKPCVSNIKRQIHARKNHSYFLVFKKRG